MRKRGDVLKGGEERERENKSRKRGEDQGKRRGEKERESGKGVDGGDDVEFGMIESERSEDLGSVVVVFRDDDVVVLIDSHSKRTVELTRTCSL